MVDKVKKEKAEELPLDEPKKFEVEGLFVKKTVEGYDIATPDGGKYTLEDVPMAWATLLPEDCLAALRKVRG